MNILAIGAHPDDVEFLCAGTLALYALEGHKIYIAIATNGNVGSPTLSKTEISKIVGYMLADKIKDKKIKKIIFDRNGYRFHGRIKAMAEAIKEKGINI